VPERLVAGGGDQLLPCDASGRPRFFGTSGAGWAALVERALTKLHGSYAALEGAEAQSILGRCDGRRRMLLSS